MRYTVPPCPVPVDEKLLFLPILYPIFTKTRLFFVRRTNILIIEHHHHSS